MMHIPTAFFLYGLTQFASSMVLTLVWYKNKQIDGLKEWAIGPLLMATSLLLLSFREYLPLMPAVVLSNGLGFLGSYFIWLGNTRFMQRRYPNIERVFLLVVLLSTVLLAVLTQVENSYQLRVVIASCMPALYALFSIVVFFPAAKKAGKTLAQLMVAAYISLFLVYLLRVAFYLNGYGGIELSIAGSATAHTILFSMFITYLILMLQLALVVDLLQKDLQEAAERDALTGAYNRRAFFTIVDKLFARARRERAPISVLLVDLDHFKKINDTYGHQVGDDVIKSFADLTHQILRSPDLFARYGGEEFVIVLPDTGAENARQTAERLRESFMQLLKDKPVPKGGATCSIGVASVEELTDQGSISEMIEQSDKALYHAKMSGRNRVCGH